jgi:hypothetical protein
MKTYKQEASEIMARGKTAYRKKQTARRAVVGTVAGVLIFSVAFGVWKQGTRRPTNENGSGTVAAPADGGTYAPEDVTEPPTESYTGAPPVTEAPATQTSEIAVVPHWEEAPCYWQYPGLSFDNVSYATTGVPIDPALTGEALGEAVSSGYDTYTDVTHTQTVSVFRIGNIKPECAVCAVLADGNTYAYVNARYTPETLGQFIADLDLKNTLSLGAGHATLRNEDGGATFIKYADFDDAILWDSLLADGNLQNEPNRAFGAQRITFSANVPALGYENKGLWITEDGCIVTNILESAKVFYIGTAAADAFIAQLRNNVPYETQENTTFAPEEGVTE